MLRTYIIQYNKKDERMITHDDIWNALDVIANNKKMTPSRMAIDSGLDATTFNKSKRFDASGKSRFPSSRTILKVLNSHQISMTEFGAICDRVHKLSLGLCART